MGSNRNRILQLLSGNKPDSPPIFSGLINITTPGLAQEGLQFHEAHHDAVKMAQAAASTYRISGFGSAVVPLDLYVEAEALGAPVDFREKTDRPEHPHVTEFLYTSVEELTAAHAESAEKTNNKNPADSAMNSGRIPLVCEAIRVLKEDVGKEIVIGAWIPGPFTLLSLLVETSALYMTMGNREDMQAALDILTQVLARVGSAYHDAGADFLTVHEMGGSPGVLGPRSFESIVLPSLQALTTALPGPIVLSACGRTNGAMRLLAASGADALSVDQTNDLAASREEVPDALLFGNLDPVGTLSQGTPSEVSEAAASAVRGGVDAIWPGCDLHPQTPLENLKALVQANQR